ncbi:MAG: DNA polymerase IV [Anaerolineae bacterium]|nr:DNA polymerase IV [Anaerolineae bacterium]
MPRKIIHLDLDAFFCAVEALRDPTLHGKAFAVGGRPEHRGVIASCSYPARKYGVRSAMPTAQALLRCPHLILISDHRGDYSAYSHRVMAHLENLTRAIEQISIDEAFIDVSDLKAPARAIAVELQQSIWQDLKLPCSLGVATNKLVAKIANNVGKASAKTDGPPMAIEVVPPGEEQHYLAPLPVTELWGVGPKTAESLEKLGIKTIGDLAGWPEADLIQRFGKHGEDLARRARGIDSRPVMSDHEVKSISHETTFSEDVTDETVLRRTLCLLSENVGRRLRRAELAATTIKVKLRWSDFKTLTRQTTLEEPTDQDSVIYVTAQQLLKENWPRGRPVRLIGVGASNLTEPMAQLRLWDASVEKGAQLQKTLDRLRDRFGRGAIRRAITLRSDDEG